MFVARVPTLDLVQHNIYIHSHQPSNLSLAEPGRLITTTFLLGQN